MLSTFDSFNGFKWNDEKIEKFKNDFFKKSVNLEYTPFENEVVNKLENDYKNIDDLNLDENLKTVIAKVKSLLGIDINISRDEITTKSRLDYAIHHRR